MSKLIFKNKALDYIIKLFLNFFKNKNSTVSSFIESKKDYRMTKLDTIPDKFYRVFFEQIVSCSLVDTEDFFCNNKQTAEILPKEINSPETSHLERFEKHMIMYHVVKFLQKNSYEIDISEINKIIFSKFDFKSAEKDRFGKYLNRSRSSNEMFEPFFANEVLKNVFYVDSISDEMIDSLSDFLNQCHKSFDDSYSTYVSLNVGMSFLKVKA